MNGGGSAPVASSSEPAVGASSIDRYRIEPPADDAGPRTCPHHPSEPQVYVAIAVTTVDTHEPAMVRGWCCRLCWSSPRGVKVHGLELERDAACAEELTRDLRANDRALFGRDEPPARRREPWFAPPPRPRLRSIHVSISKELLLREIKRLGLRAVLVVPEGVSEREMVEGIERDPRSWFVPVGCDRQNADGSCAGHEVERRLD